MPLILLTRSTLLVRLASPSQPPQFIILPSYYYHFTITLPLLLLLLLLQIMDSLSSGESPSSSSWPSALHSAFQSFLSFLHDNPTYIAILLTITLVPFVLWVDTIGKNPSSSLNKMAVKDPSADFKGNVKVNNNPPTKEDLEKVADLPVLDKNGKRHTFKSLYADNENGPRRVLIIFIRHFFCGVCSPFNTSFLPRMY